MKTELEQARNRLNRMISKKNTLLDIDVIKMSKELDELVVKEQMKKYKIFNRRVCNG
ncbi:MAG: aspartyl-phosphate phosphatase Spo0E family protein [Firmicutes bacterium]|nr:aspartyl-phosphate phosphatase Spo0E family protein [Bacillota bacterium]